MQKGHRVYAACVWLFFFFFLIFLLLFFFAVIKSVCMDFETSAMRISTDGHYYRVV